MELAITPGAFLVVSFLPIISSIYLFVFYLVIFFINLHILSFPPTAYFIVELTLRFCQ